MRLSRADVVLGGRITAPLDDSPGNLAGRANLKGVACEYMTGGTLFCHLDEGMGMDRAALRRRLAKGAGVEIRDLEEEDVSRLEELLGKYHRELLHSHQEEEADWLARVIAGCRTSFVKVVPEKTMVMPRSTE